MKCALLDHNYYVKSEKKSSYNRESKNWHTTLLDVEQLVESKARTLQWCEEVKWINSSYRCPKCHGSMMQVDASAAKASSDGKVWKCRGTMSGVRHQVERSVRKGSWIQHSNLTIEEIIKLTYMWSNDYKGKMVRRF